MGILSILSSLKCKVYVLTRFFPMSYGKPVSFQEDYVLRISAAERSFSTSARLSAKKAIKISRKISEELPNIVAFHT